MKDFQAVFDLERPRHEAWLACRIETSEPDIVRIPGFPSVDGGFGARAVVLESIPQQRLVLEKIDPPATGARVTIAIDPANASGWPTRVKITQCESAAEDDDLARTNWQQSVADFRLFLETGVEAGADPDLALRDHELGAATRETPTYLEITQVEATGFAARAGIEIGDGLVSVNGTRIYDTRQLMTVLAQRGEARRIVVRVVRNKGIVELEAPM